MWFQLPPAILAERYQNYRRRYADEGKDWPGVIVGAEMRCFPNGEDSVSTCMNDLRRPQAKFRRPNVWLILPALSLKTCSPRIERSLSISEFTASLKLSLHRALS